MEREQWRWLDLGRQGPYENAATMPVLVRSVLEQGKPILQTSIWGETHLNVGWFDDVDSTLDLQRCEDLDIAVIRRSFYGGGTAYYQAECSMMWGFLLPKDIQILGVSTNDLDALLAKFQVLFSDALRRIGLSEVQFEGSSDLRWNGRKLGALTAQDVVACVSIGGFLNLAPPDLTTYLQVVRIPEDKFKDKIVKDMTEYVCTAEQVVGHPVSYEQLRDAIIESMSAAGVDLELSALSPGEAKGVAKASGRVGSPESIRRISSDQFLLDAPSGSCCGFGNFKGRKLCRAGVALAPDGRVLAAMMAGDMHVSPPDVMDRVAAALTGADSSNTDDLRQRISTVFEAEDVHQADQLMGVTTEDLLAAVLVAVQAAASIPTDATKDENPT